MTETKTIDLNKEDVIVEAVVDTAPAIAPDGYTPLVTFEVTIASKEQENIVIDALDKMEIEYTKKPREKKIEFTCTEIQAVRLQKNVKLNTIFNTMRVVSDNITSFMKNTSDVVLQAGIAGTGAAIKAGCAVGGSVATAGIALGASVIANGSRTIKTIYKDLKHNADIKDAKSEICSAGSALGRLFGGGSVDSGLFRKVK